MSEYHQVVMAIRRVLDTARVSYKTFEHEAVRTSEEAAAIRPEYSLAQGAKALIVRVTQKGDDGVTQKQFVQVVVPGDQRFDTKKVRLALGAKDLRFATEAEVKELTGGVEPGGVPPFGNIFGVLVLVEETLLKHKEIIFNAGDRRYSIALAAQDYVRVVKPQVASVV